MADYAWGIVWDFPSRDREALICTRKFDEQILKKHGRMRHRDIMRLLQAVRDNSWRTEKRSWTTDLLGDRYNMSLIREVFSPEPANSTTKINFSGTFSREIFRKTIISTFFLPPRDSLIEKQRNDIRENWSGSRYELTRYVQTFSSKEVMNHGF